MTNFFEATASETALKIKGGEVTTEEYISSLFERIKKVETKIHAFVETTEKAALSKAREIDKNLREGKATGHLCGVGIAVKDNICVEGIRATCSSHMLQDYVPPYNATVIERVVGEGAIVVGKTNMDEFAMGSSTEHSFFGPTRNPWDPERVPGGSSGGSAASVAAREVAIAYGSDTGGSVRCPASFCGVVGLKPTYGTVSRYGLIAYANSLEQIGSIARTVEDCALLLTVMAGHDFRDSTSAKVASKDYRECLKNDVRGLRIGVPKELFAVGTQEVVVKNVWSGIKRLEGLGAACEEISLKSLEYALAAYYVIAMSEASSNLARYDGLRYGYRVKSDKGDWNLVFSQNRRQGFGAEVRRRIMLGTYALSAGYYDKYYLKALQVRTLIKRELEKAFGKFNVLIGPSMPILPFRIGEKLKDPLEMYMCDVDTVPANLAGNPAMSIPCGFQNNLPIGLQIMAPPFREDLLIQTAFTFEQNTSHSKQTPKL